MKQGTNLKNKNAITLIALVVTIVVLLILAGVSINLLVDENGIIQKSKDARNASRAGSIRDEISLWKAEKFAADNGAGSHESMDDFLTRLKDRGLISEDDINTIKDTKELVIGKETVRFPSDAKTLVQAFKDGEIKVGDYLNYNDYVDESKTCTTKNNENGWADQTYTATKNTYWQVLGLDETGEKLMLISQSPIKKEMKTDTTAKDWEKSPYLVLKGAHAYVNCKTILNNISGIYSTSLGTAQSLTAEEINRLIGVTVDYTNQKVYANTDSNTNIDKMGVLGNQYTYKATDYTPESYIDNRRHAAEGEKTEPATAYYYEWDKLTIPEPLKTMLFSGTASDANYVKAYWLASSGVCVNSERAYFGPGNVVDGFLASDRRLFYSYGYWRAGSLAVRPVVYLNSEVTLEDLQKITDPEDEWSTYSNTPLVVSGEATNGEAGNHGTESGGETGPNL